MNAADTYAFVGVCCFFWMGLGRWGSGKKEWNSFYEIFCENWQNPVKQRITPHFLTTSPSNYYEFTTKE